MKLLLLHADKLHVIPKERALKEADENPNTLEKGNVLVVFVGVEKTDKPHYAMKASQEVKEVFEKVKADSVVIYPYVHLIEEPASPRLAKETIQKLYERIRELGIECEKAPFGWYKAFTISVKGHPLSELSRVIKEGEIKEDKISESLKKEEKLKSKFFVLTPEGELIEAEKYKGTDQFMKLISYETKKVRVYEKEPPHIELMKKLELVDYEEGSDPGNMRYYPKGRLIKKILERAITEFCIDYGAHEVETPIMYDFEHPSLKNYLNRFPARQYVVLSDDKELFLRFAACFGQFLIAADSIISYRHLPFKIYELTRYSFRREQSGELAGLKRLRAFTMPDMHTLVKDMDMAREEFERQLEKSIEFLNMVGLFDNCEVAFRVVKDFYYQHEEWYKRLVKKIGKPILIEMFEERYAYFITKFEFNFIDVMGKASALSTVQIDVENAENYNITYVEKDGERKRPIILHASLSGALERVMYALLEKEAMNIEKGIKPALPIWLSPIQVRLIPVSTERHLTKVMEIAEKLKHAKVRFDIDDSDESLAKKIRRAEREWIPFIVVIGDKENMNNLSVTIRREGKRIMSLDELIQKVEKENRYYEKLNMPILLSKRPIFRERL